MPDAPGSVLPTPSEGGAPAAPSAVLATVEGGGAPAAPSSVLAAVGGGGAPTAPGSVLAGPSSGGGALEWVRFVRLSHDSGELIPVAGSPRMFSTSGAFDESGEGEFWRFQGEEDGSWSVFRFIDGSSTDDWSSLTLAEDPAEAEWEVNTTVTSSGFTGSVVAPPLPVLP